MAAGRQSEIKFVEYSTVDYTYPQIQNMIESDEFPDGWEVLQVMQESSKFIIVFIKWIA